MLSKYNKDNQEPICKPEDCQGCIRDCKQVYQEVSKLYKQEGFTSKEKTKRAIAFTERLER